MKTSWAAQTIRRTALAFCLAVSTNSAAEAAPACVYLQQVAAFSKVDLQTEVPKPLTRLQQCELQIKLEEDLISSEIDFDVAKGAKSISFGIYSPNQNAYNLVYELIDPDGKAWVDPSLRSEKKAMNGRVLSHTEVSPNPLSLTSLPDFANFQFPSLPGIKVRDGKWKLKIKSEVATASLQRDLSILIKYEDAPVKRRVLSLNLYISPSSLFPPAEMVRQMEKATGQSILRLSLSEMTEAFAKHGILVKIGRIESLSPDYDSALFTDRPNEKAASLLTKFPAKPGEINVFFLPYRNENRYVGIAPLGMASVIPGKATNLFPTVIIGEMNESQISKTLTHELIHSLGLPHTNADFFSSTKTYDHFIEGDQGFTQNLMNAENGSFDLTEEQIEVIRQSPVLFGSK